MVKISLTRREKIEEIQEFFGENSIEIIETDNLGAIIVDAQLALDKEQDEDMYNELLAKGLTEEQIEEFKEFLQNNNMMMIEIDKVSGVSFENVIFDESSLKTKLIESDLWEINMQEPEVTRVGTLDMQVCIPEDWTDVQIEDFANKENYCGTRNGWKVRKEGDKQLDGMPERNPCSERKGYVHVTLDA